MASEQIVLWEPINRAVRSILDGDVKKVEGDTWTAYSVGSNIIRIDIKREVKP
jgi:hypothetical protein